MMPSDDWLRLEPLLDLLLDAPTEQRAALLDSFSTGDAVTRRELQEILAGCERDLPMLEGHAVERFGALYDDAGVAYPPTLAARYEPQGAPVRGGMATVFRARDLKHGRDVAVKVVHPAFVGSLGRSYFLSEITIAAGLHHPHIVSLYDSGESDGFLYYIMPYLEGLSLRERLSREGPFSITDARRVLRDVADALAHAHGQGIVHRDIKPDNVLITGDHALVTDFGVAKALTAATVQESGPASPPRPGTPSYMAPEQIRNDPGVDGRADIYAFGCLAYELLTGRLPFAGPTRDAVMAGHLHDEPLPIGQIRPGIPRDLAALVMRCLAKDPADRWQHAQELLTALSRPAATRGPTWLWLGGAAGVASVLALVLLNASREGTPPNPLLALSHPPLSISVLPTSAASARGELDWVAQGLASQLPAGLTDVYGLDVRPSETITPLLSQGWTLDSVALVRGIDYFVRAGLARGLRDTVVVTLELIEHGIRSVRAGDVRMALDSLAPLGTLAAEVVEALRPMLGARVRERQLEAGSSSPVALRHRWRAEHHRVEARASIGVGDAAAAAAALDSAEASLTASERADSAWLAPRIARASLSATRALLILFQPGPTDFGAIRQTFDRGIAILDSALLLERGNPLALAMRGRLRLQRVVIGEEHPLAAQALTEAAAADLESALAADSTLARAAADLSQLLFEARGRFEDAARLAERAYRLDAYMEETSTILDRLALSRLEVGDEESARRWCAEGVRRFPANPAHHGCFLDVMAWGAGRVNPDSAWAYYHAVERRAGDRNVSARVHYLAAVAAVLARSGTPAHSDSARRVLARARALAMQQPVNAELRDELLAFEAAAHYRLGDRARADSLFAEYRGRDSLKARARAQRRMLRSYVGSGG
jgi:serine/threonine-protein kinase